MDTQDLDQLSEDYVKELIDAKNQLLIEEDETGERALIGKKRRQAALPQSDPQPDLRATWLKKNRVDYQYSYEKINGVPMLGNIPKREEFTAEYLVRRGLTFVSQLFRNEQLVKIKGILDPFNSLKSFAELFQVLPRPTLLEYWQSDEAFAEQRLSGPNPMVIRRIKNWEEMPFIIGSGKEAIVPGGEETFGAALDKGALYKCDYENLNFIKGGEGGKYVPAPKALFYWSTTHEDAVLHSLMGYQNAGQLLPLAIQIRPDLPVLVKDECDPDDWMIAKWCVQVADGNDHELRAHWCLTHMVMEPFAVATARQLAENHPLGILLRPHFRFMVHNNNDAVVKLLGKGGWIDQLMGGKIEESIAIAAHAYQKWGIKKSAFPEEIAARNMEDTDATPHYPYRDDGIRLWAAVNKYVKNYLRIYYPKLRKDLESDHELQNWCKELAAHDGGRVQEMPSSISDMRELVSIVTNIVFTCSAQHSAVNYAQYDYMATVLNMPLGAYCPVALKNDRKESFEEYALKFLPPPKRAILQQKVATLLSSFHYDKLGYYKKNDFDDTKAEKVIETFQRDLEVIEKQISVKNLERQFPYKYLLPSQILNSISI